MKTFGFEKALAHMKAGKGITNREMRERNYLIRIHRFHDGPDFAIIHDRGVAGESIDGHMVFSSEDMISGEWFIYKRRKNEKNKPQTTVPPWLS